MILRTCAAGFIVFGVLFLAGCVPSSSAISSPAEPEAEGWVVWGIYDLDSRLAVHVGGQEDAVYLIRKDNAAIESIQPDSEGISLDKGQLTASLDGRVGDVVVAPEGGRVVAVMDNVYGEDRGSTMPPFYLAVFEHDQPDNPAIIEAPYSAFNTWIAPNGQKALVNYGKIYIDIAVVDLAKGTLTPIVRPVTDANYDEYPMPILAEGNLPGPVIREATAMPNEDERIHFCNSLGVAQRSVRSSEIDVRTQSGRVRLIEIVNSMRP